MEGDFQQRFPFQVELDVEQLRITFADAAGELVIGGLAGTGKTAAALHRAAYLCSITPTRTGPAVLFLCLNRALVAAVRQRLTGFPINIRSRIEVGSIHRWCYRFFDGGSKQRSVVKADKQRVEIVYLAIREVQRTDGQPAVFSRDPYWFLAEIKIIKTCRYTELQQYLDHHSAAGSRLTANDLEAVFKVACAYDRLLWESNRMDYDDYANIVLNMRKKQSTPKQYDHVIVDEAQDLSWSQLELVRVLARRSLTLIADRQQAIYKFHHRPETLPSQEQYDVVLPTNYRSNPEIFGLARRLSPTDPPLQAPTDVSTAEVYRHFRFVEDEAAFIAEQVDRLMRAGTPPIEIAILVNLREIEAPIHKALESAGIEIAVVDGGKLVSPGVHLTTTYQAKGREFDAVFVPGLIEGVLPRLRPELDSVAQELELALGRRLLGVAMTRARHHLWLSSGEGRPSRYIYDLGLAPAPATVA